MVARGRFDSCSMEESSCADGKERFMCKEERSMDEKIRMLAEHWGGFELVYDTSSGSWVCRNPATDEADAEEYEGETPYDAVQVAYVAIP